MWSTLVLPTLLVVGCVATDVQYSPSSSYSASYSSMSPSPSYYTPSNSNAAYDTYQSSNYAYQQQAQQQPSPNYGAPQRRPERLVSPTKSGWSDAGGAAEDEWTNSEEGTSWRNANKRPTDYDTSSTGHKSSGLSKDGESFVDRYFTVYGNGKQGNLGPPQSVCTCTFGHVDSQQGHVGLRKYLPMIAMGVGIPLLVMFVLMMMSSVFDDSGMSGSGGHWDKREASPLGLLLSRTIQWDLSRISRAIASEGICSERILCRLGAAAKPYQATRGLIKILDYVLPQTLLKQLNAFKKSVVSDDDKCDKYTCDKSFLLKMMNLN